MSCTLNCLLRDGLTPMSLCFPKPNRSAYDRFSFPGTASSSHQMHQREYFRKQSCFHFLGFLSCVFSASSCKPSSFQDDWRLLSFLGGTSWSSSCCCCPAVLEAALCWEPWAGTTRKQQQTQVDSNPIPPTNSRSITGSAGAAQSVSMWSFKSRHRQWTFTKMILLIKCKRRNTGLCLEALRF